MSKQAAVLRRHGLVVTQVRVMILRVLEEGGPLLSASDIQEQLVQQGISLRSATINNVLRRFRLSGLSAQQQTGASSKAEVDI